MDDVIAIRDAGRRPRLRPDEYAIGAGAAWVMAPFVDPSPLGSRFSDGTYGVYYAARTEETAVVETTYHYARFLAFTHETPRVISVRVLHATLAGTLTDIRGQQERHPELYDPDPSRYAPAQRWAAAQRQQGAMGIAYTSVRHPPGEGAAIFRPSILRPCVPKHFLLYEWDGTRIAGVQVMRPRAMGHRSGT